jgi:hypothetical protein
MCRRTSKIDIVFSGSSSEDVRVRLADRVDHVHGPGPEDAEAADEPIHEAWQVAALALVEILEVERHQHDRPMREDVRAVYRARTNDLHVVPGLASGHEQAKCHDRQTVARAVPGWLRFLVRFSP